MSQDNQGSRPLEERVKRLETLQRNTRIAIIILVGYSIYDVISVDTGSEIIFAHKVKAREFELIDGTGTIYSNWKVLESENKNAGLVIQNSEGEQITMTAEGVKLTSGRVNPAPVMILDNNGVELFEPTHSEQQQPEQVE